MAGRWRRPKGLKVHLWNVGVPARDPVDLWKPDRFYSVDVDATGRLLAIAFAKGVRFFDLADDREVLRFCQFHSAECGIKLHPVDGSLVTANANERLLARPIRVTNADFHNWEIELGPPHVSIRIQRHQTN